MKGRTPGTWLHVGNHITSSKRCEFTDTTYGRCACDDGHMGVHQGSEASRQFDSILTQRDALVEALRECEFELDRCRYLRMDDTRRVGLNAVRDKARSILANVEGEEK